VKKLNQVIVLMFKINEPILLKKMFFGNSCVNFIFFCLETKETKIQA